jgi:HEAT repeat protein
LLETWMATDEKTVARLRGYCFQELRAIKSQEFVKILCLQLRDGDRTLRERELLAIKIGDIGCVTALPALHDAIVADKGEPGTGRPIARACIYALGNMGEESYPALMKIWRDETLREGCKDMVLISMGQTKDKRFIPTLLEALGDKSVTIRDRAALALGDIGDNTALPALKKHLQDPDELFKETVRNAIIKIEKQDENIKKEEQLKK